MERCELTGLLISKATDNFVAGCDLMHFWLELGIGKQQELHTYIDKKNVPQKVHQERSKRVLYYVHLI